MTCLVGGIASEGRAMPDLDGGRLVILRPQVPTTAVQRDRTV